MLGKRKKWRNSALELPFYGQLPWRLHKIAKPFHTHFRAKDIDFVLSGGAYVSIYSHEKYVSMDLDMIHTGLFAPKRKLLRDAMSELGFFEEGCYFKHKNTKFFIKFPNGPPSVREEPIKEICERKESAGVLRIISPTDCVKDRLTWFYRNNDMQCLEQAILVTRDNGIDFKELKRFSRGEGKVELFHQVLKKIKGRA